MWNSQNPLKLLLSMPSHLTKENLERLQAVIDVDKMVNSAQFHRDLCGEYAPFCDYCDKSVKFPCAHAYVKMKQSEGLDVEVPEEVYNELQIKKTVEETAVTEEVEEAETEVETTAEPEKPKRYIRIAVAKKTR